ncbi:ankyrin repeat-containing domain protein [Hyaloscypha finlandica]|nr:ankyrin repeat-containing domain protein [Hyaloscypha finlandica]
MNPIQEDNLDLQASMDAFVEARQSFIASLSADDLALLGNSCTAEDVLAEVRKAEEEHRDRSKSRKYVKGIEPFVRGAEQYGKAVDVFIHINTKPEILALILGAAKLVLQLAGDFIDFFERIVDMFRRLGKSLGRFEIYARLYPTSERLKSALVEAYGKFLGICLLCKGVFKEKSAKRMKWLPGTSSAIALKSLWKPVKSKLEATLEELDELLEGVEKEADVAEKMEASIARVTIKDHVTAQRCREMFEWLGGVDPSINHYNAVKLHLSGTGGWIFADDSYKTWENEQNATLWLHAKPGAGKTILMSTIIDHIGNFVEDDHGDTISYFYFDYKDINKRDSRKAIETLIVSMSRQSPAALAYVEDISKKYREFKSQCTFPSLCSILKKCLDFQQRNFIILDALDECNDREELLPFLVELSKTESSGLNLLMSSRRETDIQRQLDHLPQITLAEASNAHDIDLYIQSRLQEMINGKKLKLRDPSLQEEIFQCLTSRANGMFQWVKCQLDVLCTLITDKSIRAALTQLPKSLDETYVRAFSKIRIEMGEDSITIKKLFQWLTHSLRPLTLRELAEAISIEIGQARMDFSAVPTDPEDILRFCGGLVTIAGHDDQETVNFSHFSIKEFLLSLRILDTEVAEFYGGSPAIIYDVAATCITYIMMDDFADGQCLEVTKLKERGQKYGFLNYAASQWDSHYKEVDSASQGELEDFLWRFFIDSDMAGPFESWLQQLTELEHPPFDDYELHPNFEEVHWWGNEQERVLTVIQKGPPLYYAACLGLASLVKKLVEKGHDMNVKFSSSGGEKEFPILAAASRRHWDTVGLMVDSGARLDVSSEDGKTLLSSIATASDPQLWPLFNKVLEKGGIVESPRPILFRDSLLGTLALDPSDSWDKMELLIRNGADVDEVRRFKIRPFSDGYRHYEGNPPLQLAAFQGNMRVVKGLIQAGARIDFSHCELGSPLQAAALANREEVVMHLLDLGANVNAFGGFLGTPLQAAAFSGNTRIVNLFLGHGADVNIKGGFYGEALSAALAQKHKDIVKVLISNGSELDSISPHRERYRFESFSRLRIPYSRIYCDTPLKNAIRTGDTSIVQTLLDAGARISAENISCGKSTHPICLAIIQEDLPMVKLLLENEGDPTVYNHCALVKAVSVSNFSIFELLFSKLNWQSEELHKVAGGIVSNVSGEGLVSATVENECFPLTEYLLKKGFTPNAAGWKEDAYDLYFKRIPLPTAVRNRRPDICSLLLDYGADPNVHDRRSGTPLYASVKVGNLELVSRFLDLGSLPNEDVFVNNGCSKVVHVASTHQQPAILEELLKYGANLNARCPSCPSALMAAVKLQRLETMELLIKAGAKISEPDDFGRTPLSRAKDGHFELAANMLSELDAKEHIPLASLRSCLQNSVNSLVSQLLLPPDPRWQFGSGIYMPWLLWIALGRCLILGTDIPNGLTALERTLFRDNSGVSCQPECCYCGEYEGTIFHLCKDCDGSMLCGNCVERHGILFRDSKYEHTLVDFCRDGRWNVPEGQVVLEDGSYVTVETWLKQLQDCWVANV